MSVTDNPHIANRYVFAGMFSCITMMAAMLWMPATLGVLAQGFALDAGSLGRLASAETVGFLLATLFTSTRTITRLKVWVLCGGLLIIGANLVLVQFAPDVAFMAMRPLAGLGSGLWFGFALKVCALSRHPTRSFGILTGFMSVMMIVGFQAAAFLTSLQVTEQGAGDIVGIQGVARTIFAIFALFAVCGLVVYLFNQPPVANVNTAMDPTGLALPSPLVMVCLLAIILTFIGQGSVWAFLQTLGVSHGFTVGNVANAMSVFAIFGIIGSFSAATLPQNTIRWAVIGAALLALMAGLYALYSPSSVWWYMAGCAIGGFYWNFALPLILGLLAKIDHTGSGSVLGGTMSSVGSAAGPLLAGLLIRGSDYQPVGWMAGIFCLVGLLCVWHVECRSIASLQTSSS